MNDDRDPVDLHSLINLFPPGAELGRFEEVDPADVPDPYQRLLDHHSHMTVALESFHQSPLDLRVLDVRDASPIYARKISLSRRRDGQTVLFGIVRLREELLPIEAMREIRDQAEPLGHVLIRQNVLREVERLRLWRVAPNAELRGLFGGREETMLYGRTALIYCNGQPAIELLEIVYVPPNQHPSKH